MPPEAMLGFDTADDAAVWRIAPNIAGILTIDFLTPIVDEPYDFGESPPPTRFPTFLPWAACPMWRSTWSPWIRPCLNMCRAICCAEASKKSSRRAPLLWAAIPSTTRSRNTACAFSAPSPPTRSCETEAQSRGDTLYLTKPLGTGIASAGRKVGILDDAAFSPVVESMAELNRAAGEAMVAAGVHAATDVTGFGLAGHLHEMLSASACAASINWSGVPTFAETVDLARQWCRPARSFSVEDFAQPFLHVPDNQMGEDATAVLCDPQTSGGMLCAIPSEAAATFEEEFAARCGRTPAKIGRVIEGESGHIHVVE